MKNPYLRVCVGGERCASSTGGRGHNRTLVTPGLDPGLHHFGARSFATTMDRTATRACPSCAVLSAASRVNPTCGSSPAMTDLLFSPVIYRGGAERPMRQPCLARHRKALRGHADA